jgi:PAS domain S-box-containing protein
MQRLNFWRTNLRARLLFSLAIIASVTIVIVAVVINLALQGILLEQVDTSEEATIENQIEDVYERLEFTENNLRFLANSQNVNNLAQGLYTNQDSTNLASLKNAVANDFLAITTASEIYSQVRFMDALGNELVRVDNLDGAILVVAEDELDNNGQRDYFQNTIRQAPGQVYIAPLSLDKEDEPARIVGNLAEGTAIPTLRYGLPIYVTDSITNQEVVIGVVVINILAEVLFEFIEPLADDAQSYLINQDGYYLYNSAAPHRTFGFEPGIEAVGGVAESKAQDDFPSDSMEIFLTVPDLQEEHTSNIFRHSIRITPPSAPEGYYWVYISSRDPAVVFGDVNRFIRNVVIGLVVATILGVVFFGLFLGQITQPLQQLAQTARQIAQGNLRQRSPLEQREDEFGVLAQSFNQMADQLGGMVGSLEERVQERTQNLLATLEVGRVATSLSNQEELLPRLVDYIRQRFDLYHTQIYLLDDSRAYLVLAASTGEVGQQLLARRHRLALKDVAIVTQTLQTGQPVLVANTVGSTIHKPNPLLPDTRSELAIPLRVADDVLGVLDMQAAQANTFTEDNQVVFEAMASQIAASIVSTRSYSASQIALQEVDKINRRMTESAWMRYFEQVDAGQHLGYFYDLESPKPLAEAPALPDQTPLQKPIELRGQPIGNIILAETDNRDWDTEEIRLVNDVADRVALVLEQMRASDETRAALAQTEELARQLQTVAEVSSQVTSTLDAEALIQNLVDLAKDRFGLYHAHIYLIDSANQNLVLSAGAGEVGRRMTAQKRVIPLATEHSLVAQAARFKQVVVSNDVRRNPDFLPNPLLPATRSEMAVPMLVGQVVVGVWDVQSDKVNRFSTEDEQVQFTLASQTAIAIQNAELYQSTIEQAKELVDFKTAIDEAAIVAITDQTGKIIYVNDAFVNVSKYSRQELLGQDHRLINSGYHDADFIRNVWVTIANGGIWHGEFRNRAKDGSFYWVDTTIVPFLNEQGKPFQYIAIRYLITNRKEAEEKIAKRANELQIVAQVSAQAAQNLDAQSLLKNVADLTKAGFDLYHAHIYLLDETGERLVLAAGAGEVGDRMVAQGRSIPYNSPTSLVALAAREKRGVIVNNVQENPQFLPNPLLPKTRSELAIPLMVAGEVLGVLDVQGDQVGRFTEEDVQVKTTLADQVAVALQTSRLYSEQVQVADQLREVDRLKSEFLASMSHELRTPLNSIIGYAEVILDGIDGPINEDINEDVSAIYSSGKLLLSLINDILDLAKIEAGQLSLDADPIEVAGFLENVTDTSRILLKDTQVDLVVEVDADIPPIVGDRLRLQQILNNLISNAAKFTEEGTITVRGKRENGMVRFEVEDTGLGIKQEQIDLIFERFRQADQSSTRRAGGTGLGLAITRQLVEMHGGDIGVESQEGVGSTFWFTMPIARH